jgi:predicted CXXCH cytochrome family protein
LWLLVLALLGGGAVFAVVKVFALSRRSDAPPPLSDSFRFPRQLAAGERLDVWWDVFPSDIKGRSVRSGDDSNIHPSDYIGPQSCQTCHQRNYESWSHHPHRWMNALASEETVKGDFSGSTISYWGGWATFYRDGDSYRMRLERGDIRRTYEITQTIGSRFFQYYVGKQIEGPEPKGHRFYTKDHLLQLGYWLDQKEWVPVVHIGPEKSDEERPDPFKPPDNGHYYAEYATSCNTCHTTFPLADLFGRRTQQMGSYAPLPMHWSMRPYIEEAHPDMLTSMTNMSARGKDAPNPMNDWDAPTHAVTLGVSCEACHLGAKAHVQSQGKIPPKFFPASPHLLVESKESRLDFGRSQANVNWACGRCHVGTRPKFAAGMSTWNSVEYSDAMLGSCYSQLRCIDCHNPHKAIGPKWSAPPDKDDAVCLKCHDKFTPEPQRVAHMHHPMGSEGARCLNCHMPRINEGVQDVVRTHTIFSPTRADMIEANQPNACNLCHTDQPIDWTLDHLKQWYGKTYNKTKIAAVYPERTKPVALGWLHRDNPSVRLVAVEALTRAQDFQALPELINALDDPYLINRQFAYKGLQEMLDVRLTDFGYRFYMTREERRKPLADLRARFQGAADPKSRNRPPTPATSR